MEDDVTDDDGTTTTKPAKPAKSAKPVKPNRYTAIAECPEMGNVIAFTIGMTVPADHHRVPRWLEAGCIVHAED